MRNSGNAGLTCRSPYRGTRNRAEQLCPRPPYGQLRPLRTPAAGTLDLAETRSSAPTTGSATSRQLKHMNMNVNSYSMSILPIASGISDRIIVGILIFNPCPRSQIQESVSSTDLDKTSPYTVCGGKLDIISIARLNVPTHQNKI
jgi:hypothetical protein